MMAASAGHVDGVVTCTSSTRDDCTSGPGLARRGWPVPVAVCLGDDSLCPSLS